MVNFNSGLEALFAKQPASDNGVVDVIITERRDVKILQLSYFETQEAVLKKQLAAYGVSDIPHFSQFKAGKRADKKADKKIGAARVEMEKIWLIADALLTDCDGQFYPLDLSSARNVIRVSGPRAADVMARICAVDFREKTRNFYATNMHHVGVHIHHHDDIFDIYMPRSFAESLTELLIDISRQYHVQMA